MIINKLTRRELAKETIFVNELNKVENKLDEPLDKDKRIYKQVILANANDNEVEPIDYIRIHKRTARNQLIDPDYEYKIKINPYCQVWKKTLTNNFIENSIPKDGEKILLKEKIKKENELLKVCNQCGSARVKTNIIVSKSTSSNMKLKKRFIKIGEFNYIGPFSLFNKLKSFHENSFLALAEPGLRETSSQRISGILQEISSISWSKRILQFDIIRLYTEYSELFWNLAFLFTKENKEFTFLLPYEKDIENFYKQDENSNSDNNDSPKFYQDNNSANKRDSEIFKMWAKHSGGTVTKNNSNPSTKGGLKTDRRGSRFLEVLKFNPNAEQRDKHKHATSRNRKKRKSI